MSIASPVEHLAEAVAERTATAGQKLGRALGWTLVATLVVHALTTFRHWTVCWTLDALGRALTEEGQAPGYFATIAFFISQTYDHTWTTILGWAA